MKTIFFDVDTQNDFMNSGGRLYVPDAESIKPNLEQLTKFACENGIPIFGSVDKHFGTPEYKDREGELSKWGGPFPDHCMDGTEGQKKIIQTLERRTPRDGSERERNWLVYDEYVSNPLKGKKAILSYSGLIARENVWINADEDLFDLIQHHIKENTAVIDCPDNFRNKPGFLNFCTSGIFFEKQSYDVATNPYFDKVMDAVKPERVVVYGVATDYCVKAAVLGLVKHAKEIYVVTDAVKGITPESTKETFDLFKSLGVKFATSRDVLEGKL